MTIKALASWFGGKRTLAPEVLIINGPSLTGSCVKCGRAECVCP